MPVKYRSPLLKSLHVFRDAAIESNDHTLQRMFSRSIGREIMRLEDNKRVMRDLRQNQVIPKLPKPKPESR